MTRLSAGIAALGIAFAPIGAGAVAPSTLPVAAADDWLSHCIDTTKTVEAFDRCMDRDPANKKPAPTHSPSPSPSTSSDSGGGHGGLIFLLILGVGGFVAWKLFSGAGRPTGHASSIPAWGSAPAPSAATVSAPTAPPPQPRETLATGGNREAKATDLGWDDEWD